MVARYLQNIKPDPRISEDVLGAVSQVESGGNPKAVGPLTRFGRAQGEFQLLPSTAADLGVDPMNPIEARQGGRTYLSWLVGQTGNLSDALTAYNWGLGNLKNRGRENAPAETKSYVKKVMALIGKDKEGAQVSLAEAPLNPSDPTPQPAADEEATLPSVEAEKPATAPPSATAAPSEPSPGVFTGSKHLKPLAGSSFMKNSPIAMVEALLQDPMNIVKMAGGGFVKKMLGTLYKKANPEVSGLMVREEIPNLSSIESSLSNYEELPGVREVPMRFFSSKDASGTRQYPDKPTAYSVQRSNRVEELARQLSETGEINPLIIAHGKKGPYVIEGSHRFDALKLLGKESFPAVVIRDMGYAHGGYVLPPSKKHVPHHAYAGGGLAKRLARIRQLQGKMG